MRAPPLLPSAPGRAPYWHGVAAAAVLLLVKEDMGLLIAGFGIYMLLTRRRWTGLVFLIGGVLATWIAPDA